MKVLLLLLLVLLFPPPVLCTISMWSDMLLTKTMRRPRCQTWMQKDPLRSSEDGKADRRPSLGLCTSCPAPGAVQPSPWTVCSSATTQADSHLEDELLLRFMQPLSLDHELPQPVMAKQAASGWCFPGQLPDH